MGHVYRARDTQLGRGVAIKVIPAAQAADPERRARFEREARLLAALNHPNIAAVYGFGDADGVRGLVLELVEGETLAERLAAIEGRGAGRPAGSSMPAMAIDEALKIARQIALASRPRTTEASSTAT